MSEEKPIDIAVKTQRCGLRKKGGTEQIGPHTFRTQATCNFPNTNCPLKQTNDYSGTLDSWVSPAPVTQRGKAAIGDTVISEERARCLELRKHTRQ